MYVMLINLINLSERANVSTFTVFKTKPDGRRVFGEYIYSLLMY